MIPYRVYMIRTMILSLILIAPAMAASGCAAPLLMASAAPIGSAAVRSGTASYVNGSLRTARKGSLDDIWLAAHLALDELDLEVKVERFGKRRWYVMAKDGSKGPEMRITLDRRSPVMTRISIRVGILGDPSVSRMLMRHIDLHLQQSHMANDLLDPV